MELNALLELLCYAAAVERDTEVVLESMLTEEALRVLIALEDAAARN